jgi:hypothetical protein
MTRLVLKPPHLSRVERNRKTMPNLRKRPKCDTRNCQSSEGYEDRNCCHPDSRAWEWWHVIHIFANVIMVRMQICTSLLKISTVENYSSSSICGPSSRFTKLDYNCRRLAEIFPKFSRCLRTLLWILCTVSFIWLEILSVYSLVCKAPSQHACCKSLCWQIVLYYDQLTDDDLISNIVSTKQWRTKDNLYLYLVCLCIWM